MNIKRTVKKIILRIPYLYKLWICLKELPRKDLLCKQLMVTNNGGGNISKYIKGKNNLMRKGNNSFLNNVKIRIIGDNNTIIFKENCNVGKNCSFWMEGNNITIVIGENTTFTHSVHFCAQEDNSSIIVGKDCMFANTIIVRTSDSHPIYDLKTQRRINPAKNVVIGNHVWIAPNTKIMKGSNIGNNTIIGSNTMVTKDIPSNSLAVGTPAKVVKTDVNWTREKIF